jgi:hypothetical protein
MLASGDFGFITGDTNKQANKDEKNDRISRSTSSSRRRPERQTFWLGDF